MKKTELVALTRRFLGDVAGKVWNDTELERFIDEAARRYAEDAECFHAAFPFFPAADGGYEYPEDMICLLVAWNRDGENILPQAHHDLTADEAAQRGVPKFIFDDLNDPGKFRLAPDPEEMQGVTPFEVDEWGEIVEGGPWGVIDEGFGVVLDADGYTFVGDAEYVRSAKVEEIRDYLALVYHAMYQAYNTDAEFANPELAQIYLARYRRRVAMFGQVKHQNAGLSRAGNFF